MPFQFSRDTHQWCPQCGGNIRREPEFCRFCHKHLASKFLKTAKFPFAAQNLDEASKWLPEFNDVIGLCSQSLRGRLEQADLAANKTTGELTNEQRSEFLNQRQVRRKQAKCGEMPPEPRVVALVTDILLNIREHSRLPEALFDNPRLSLLSLSADTIEQEARGRLEAEKNGSPCKYCLEFRLHSRQDCPFCGGSENSHPVQLDVIRIFIKPIDEPLLRSVILFEAARLQNQGESLLSAEMLQKYNLDACEIDSEIEREKEFPQEAPLSSWRRKIKQLKLVCDRPFEETAMEDILALAQSCNEYERGPEAEIVYKHGLERVKGNKHLQLANQRIHDGLAMLYYMRKDYEKHHFWKEKAGELKQSLLPEHMRQISKDSEKDFQSILDRLDGNRPLDPKAEIEQAKERLKLLRQRQEKLFAQASPAMKEAMQSIIDSINKLADSTITVATLQIEASQASKAGDYAKAETLLSEALSKLSDDASDISRRATLLSAMADNEARRGNLKEADSLHKGAIAKAEELSDLFDEQEYLPLLFATLAYAQFLAEQGEDREAQKQLLKTLEYDEKLQNKYAREIKRGKRGDSEFEAQIKTELSKIYRRNGRESEAAELERDVERIDAAVSEHEARSARERRNYLEMVTETDHDSQPR